MSKPWVQYDRKILLSPVGDYVIFACLILPGKPSMKRGACFQSRPTNWGFSESERYPLCQCDSHRFKHEKRAVGLSQNMTEVVVMLDNRKVLPLYELHVRFTEPCQQQQQPMMN